VSASVKTVSSAKPGLTSVIIVAADSGDGLVDCIASVLASTAPVETIVSDNASSDGSIEKVAARWPNDAKVRIVHNGKNLGFGSGCNRGAQHASGDAILFLNPDCRLSPNDIATMREVLDADSTIRLIGASIESPNGIEEPASRRRDPILRRALMSMSGLSRWEVRWPALQGVDAPRSDVSLQDVDSVSGAVMLIPRAMFDRLSGFDEGYFLHCEDLDIGRRARDAGARVVCANDIRIAHGKGGSSRHRPLFVAWHKHRGMWRWFIKFDPAARNPLLRVVVWCGLWLRFCAMTPVYLLKKALHRQR
jgi:N-acetylglucosaminyl-diphospho-decaprenol L-rhamnosyltransferase